MQNILFAKKHLPSCLPVQDILPSVCWQRDKSAENESGWQERVVSRNRRGQFPLTSFYISSAKTSEMWEMERKSRQNVKLLGCIGEKKCLHWRYMSITYISQEKKGRCWKTLWHSFLKMCHFSFLRESDKEWQQSVCVCLRENEWQRGAKI